MKFTIRSWSRRFLFPAALFVTFAFAVSLPEDAQTAAMKKPMMTAKIKPSAIKLERSVEQQILAVTRDLVTKRLGAKLDRSISSRAETKILQKLPKGFLAEAIVQTLRKDVFSAEMARIQFKFIDGKAVEVNVNEDFQPAAGKTPASAPKNVDLEKSKNKLLAQGIISQAGASLPLGAVALANTYCGSIDSAVSATNNIYETFRKRFGDSVQKRIGDESTEGEILKFLQNDSNLLAWNNIGHASTASSSGRPCYGLLQADDTITDEEFTSLTPSQGLYSAVVLTNSCNSFKDPLAAAIWSRGTRTYIGGNILLPIGRSEPVDELFWENILIKNMTMAAALDDAQQQKGFPIGTFGLKGDTGVFSALTMSDLGTYGFLKIGKNKKEVKWNETVVLTPEDATLISGGKAAFEISYSYREYNGFSASGFRNSLLFNGQEVTQQTNLSIGPKEIKEVHTQAYFGLQDGKLQIKIDADNAIPEIREDNNFNFFVTIKFKGFD
jgi:hypothetical protein